MPSIGRVHFDTYTEQNRVKHAILSKYFNAYLQALSRAAEAFHYIDAFAGPGTYAETNAGSPLYALDLLSNQARPYAASFVESDAASCEKLERLVRAAPAGRAQLEPPWVLNAEFSDCIDEILARPVFRRFGAVATFALGSMGPERPIHLGLRKDPLQTIRRMPSALQLRRVEPLAWWCACWYTRTCRARPFFRGS